MDVSRMGDKLVIARLLENPANPTETVTERCDPGRSNDRVCLLIAYDPDEKDRETPVSPDVTDVLLVGCEKCAQALFDEARPRGVLDLAK